MAWTVTRSRFSFNRYSLLRWPDVGMAVPEIPALRIFAPWRDTVFSCCDTSDKARSEWSRQETRSHVKAQRRKEIIDQLMDNARKANIFGQLFRSITGAFIDDIQQRLAGSKQLQVLIEEHHRLVSEIPALRILFAPLRLGETRFFLAATHPARPGPNGRGKKPGLTPRRKGAKKSSIS
jgi:hypothetical protein